MLFGLDGIEAGRSLSSFYIVCWDPSGFPVRSPASGSAVISPVIIAGNLDSSRKIHAAVDTNSTEYAALIAEGVRPTRDGFPGSPELPRALRGFSSGWEIALDKYFGFGTGCSNAFSGPVGLKHYWPLSAFCRDGHCVETDCGQILPDNDGWQRFNHCRVVWPYRS
jgi:hypothetical protein